MGFLDNEGTSRAFYCIVYGLDTPKEIADRLGLAPPSVLEQLRRLEEIHLIKRGPKQGKFQPYAILWQNVTKTFVETFPKLALWQSGKEFAMKSNMKPARWDPDTKKLVGYNPVEDYLLPEKLEHSKMFTALIADYLSRMIKEEGGPENAPNLVTVIASLEEGLVRRFGSIKKPQTRGESAEFYKLLEEWFMHDSEMLTGTSVFLIESLRTAAKLEYDLGE